jgi:two-component system sensor histidine kinase AlgZ
MPFMARTASLQFPSFWTMQTVGWTCFYIVGLAGSMPDLMSRPGVIREHMVSVGFMLLGSSGLRPICRSLVRRSVPWLAFALRAALCSLAFGSVIAFAANLTISGIYKLKWPAVLGNSVQFTFVFFMWCTLYLSIKQWQQSTLERERFLQAETEAREARLRALRSQLNPHFLFNSLNAVSTLVLDGNTAAATRMLAQIGDLLRTSLDGEVMLEVPLAQEIAFTEQYIAIELTRLGDRLRVDFAVSPETLGAAVPGMLLQPLVENAVRHGIAPVVEGGRIAIESRLREDKLRIVIKNSGRTVSEEQKKSANGIGRSNTAERLRTLYGAEHRFILNWPEQGGCEVTVELPFRMMADHLGVLPCER